MIRKAVRSPLQIAADRESYGLLRPCTNGPWLDTGAEAVAGSAGAVSFYRRDGHLLRVACEVNALPAA